MTQCFFVTGTDTDAGKTLVSAALLNLAAQQGLNTVGLKPLAAGGIDTRNGLRNDDALVLQQQATLKLDYGKVNPVLVAEPMAPHIAAQREGKALSLNELVENTTQSLSGVDADFCVIEGAGGWRVPLNACHTTADLVQTLSLPVILVVGIKLGCLNHALLTAEAISRDGLEIAGWVATQIDPHMAAVEENLETLKQMLPYEQLGFVPWLENATPEEAAGYLCIDSLVQVLRKPS